MTPYEEHLFASKEFIFKFTTVQATEVIATDDPEEPYYTVDIPGKYNLRVLMIQNDNDKPHTRLSILSPDISPVKGEVEAAISNICGHIGRQLAAKLIKDLPTE